MVKREGFCLKWSSLSYISENNIESMACRPTILILDICKYLRISVKELQISVKELEISSNI